MLYREGNRLTGAATQRARVRRLCGSGLYVMRPDRSERESPLLAPTEEPTAGPDVMMREHHRKFNLHSVISLLVYDPFSDISPRKTGPSD
jgi:hypothetical protein